MANNLIKDELFPDIHGLGIDVRVNSANTGGLIITGIKQGGPAARNGKLALGDKIIGINGTSVESMPGISAFNVLRTAVRHGPVSLDAIRYSSSIQQGTATDNIVNDSRPVFNNAQIRRVGVMKNINGFGIDIRVSRSEGTTFVVVTSVKNIGSGLAAGLQVGDILIAFAGNSLIGISLKDAVKILARAKLTDWNPHGAMKSYTVDLPQTSSDYGITFGDLNSDGSNKVVIKALAPGSVAARDGRLQTGQIVKAINGNSIEGVPAARAVTLLTMSKLRHTSTVLEVLMSNISLDHEQRKELILEYIPHGSEGRSHPLQSGSLSTDTSREPLSNVDREKNIAYQALLAEREAHAQTERDYDEIVTLLEAEVGHLRAQLVASPSEVDRLLMQYRQRCVELSCQLNKATLGKNLSDTVASKLLEFSRATRNKLVAASHQSRISDPRLNTREDGSLRHRPSQGKPPPSNDWAVGDPCLVPSKGGGNLESGVIHAFDLENPTSGKCLIKFERPTGTTHEVFRITDLQPYSSSIPDALPNLQSTDVIGGHLNAVEAQILRKADALSKAVTEILHHDALPFGWEEAYTAEGKRYYINHSTHSTSWKHPTTHVVDDGRPETVFSYPESRI